MSYGMLDHVCAGSRSKQQLQRLLRHLCRACYRNGMEKSSGVEPAHPGGVAASKETSGWHRRELQRRPAGARAEPFRASPKY